VPKSIERSREKSPLKYLNMFLYSAESKYL
jgi:hypothetical protein